jgi:hypothetical protein
MDKMPQAEIKAAFKQYRKDVPSVGTISDDAITKLLAEGKICRGWTTLDGQRKYFHIIKSLGSYPEKSVFYGDTETQLFEMTVFLGMQRGIALIDLLTD